MKLEHIALTITDHTEIIQFYQKILGFSEIRSFNLQKDLAREIFGIERETKVFHLQKEDLSLELFLMPERFEHVFNHICISISDREALAIMAVQNGFECIRARRQNAEMIFLKDKCGNLFELKQS